MGKEIMDSANSQGTVKLIESRVSDLVRKKLPDLEHKSAKEIRDFFDAHQDDYVMFESSLKDDILDHMTEEYSHLVETDKKTIAEKKEIREEACKNIWKAYMTTYLVQNRFSIADRTTSSLLEFDLSDEAFERNQHYCNVMTNGRPDEKKRAVEQKLASFKPLDFEKFDFADDRKFAKNVLPFYDLAIRCDLQNNRLIAKAYGIDLTEKRFENFCKDTSIHEAIFLAYQNRITYMANPLYENTRFHQITTPEEIKKLYSDPYVVQDSITELALGAIHNNLMSSDDFLKSVFTLQNPALPLQQRVNIASSVPQKFDLAGHFREAEARRNTEFNNATLDKKLEMVSRGEHLQDTPSGFFAKQIRKSSRDLANMSNGPIDSVVKTKTAELLTAMTMQKEYTKDILNNVSQEVLNQKYSDRAFNDKVNEFKNSSEFNSFSKRFINTKQLKELKYGYKDVPQRLLSSFENFKLERTQMKELDEKQYYKTLLEENINTIKACDETFEVKEEDKAKIYSDERIVLHQKAKAFLEEINKTTEFFNKNNPGNVPPMFARAMPYLLKKGDSEEINNENLKMLSDITDQTITGDFARKELLIKTLNEVNTIKPIDYEALDTDSKRLDFCMEQFNKCRLAFICQGDLQKSGDSGFKLSDEAYRKFKSNSQMLENISTETMSYINLLASEEYLTMPTEQMSEHFKNNQVNLQLSMVEVQKNEASNRCMQTMFLVNDLLNGKANSAELKANPMQPSTLTLSDFKETQPAHSKFCGSLNDIRRAFAESYVTLKNADHFYNLRNSKEYTSLLDSLERADFVMERQKDIIDEKNGPQLYKTIADVLDKAQQYTNKYANTQMNKTRQTRFDACTKLINYLGKAVTPDKATAEEADYKADNRFTAFVKNANEKTAMKKDGTYTKNRVKQMRDFADKITDGLETVKASFKEGSTERNAATYLKLTREELAQNLTSRFDMPEERKVFLLAGMACLSPLVKEGVKPEGLTALNLSEICDKTVKNPKFVEFAKSFTKEKMAVLLSGYGEKSFNENCAKILNPETKTAEKSRTTQQPDISLNI